MPIEFSVYDINRINKLNKKLTELRKKYEKMGLSEMKIFSLMERKRRKWSM